MLEKESLIMMHETESKQHLHLKTQKDRSDLHEEQPSHSPSDYSEYQRTKANSHEQIAGSKAGKYTKSLSLELSSELHKTLKRLALQQDDTLNSLVIEAIKQFIKNDELISLKQEALRKRLSR